MDQSVNTLIAIGKCFESPKVETLELARTLRHDYFRVLIAAKFSGFLFLEHLAFQDAFDYVKGLVWCERQGLCPSRGSVSLVIRAFHSLRTLPLPEWARIADWVVEHHDNNWSPFGFQRTRDQWLWARRKIGDPEEIARRVFQMENEYQAHKRATAARREVREYINRLHKESPPSSEELRQRIVEEMEREAGWPDLK